MTANCYGGSNVAYMLILHSKYCINVPIGSRSNTWSGYIWNVPNLLLADKWQVPSTRAYNVLKMFLLVSRPPCPQWQQTSYSCPSRASQGITARHRLHAGLIFSDCLRIYRYNIVVFHLLSHSEYIPLLPQAQTNDRTNCTYKHHNGSLWSIYDAVNSSLSTNYTLTDWLNWTYGGAII